MFPLNSILPTLDPDRLNNTKHAGARIVFFNRVAKVGSEAMMELLKLMARENDFIVAKDIPFTPLDTKLLELRTEVGKANVVINLEEDTVYIEHFNYINFTRYNLPTPIYFNLVRDPVERVISWYFYIRGAHKNAIMFQRLPDSPVESPAWFKKDFNKCVRTADPECVYPQYATKDFRGDYRRQVLFFCGFSLDCLPFNSPTAMQIAKWNVDRKYAVVGSWEDTNVTLSVLEHFIPRYFKGVRSVFNMNHFAITHQNKNTRKPKIDEDVREMLRKNFTNEYEFYYFCKQRLYKQFISLNLKE